MAAAEAPKDTSELWNSVFKFVTTMSSARRSRDDSASDD